ncbi:MAG: hypothetical protein E6590_09930 [Clostridiales bacterium]|nr:hypothetical protein [Clostridiales bacterium]
MADSAEDRVMQNLRTIEEWALQGMSQKEMAECLGIGESTFRKIKKQNVALLAVLKQCANTRKKILEEQVKSVEISLFERAKGYEYTKKVPIKVKEEYYNEEGKKCTSERVEMVEEIVHVPADIQAAKFFLQNRAKKAWQDNPHKVENDREVLKLRKKEAEAKEW